MGRTASARRETAETEIRVELDLDSPDPPSIQTPLPFFSHMLEQLGKHGRFLLSVNASGDVEVDSHHLVEDVGITLGEALDEALDQREGIRRFASLTVPLDESLVRASLDVSGRSYLDYNLTRRGSVEGFPLEVVPEFFRGLVNRGNLTLHLDEVKSSNRHHLLEAAFKASARVLGRATRTVGDGIPSTKGTLSD